MARGRTNQLFDIAGKGLIWNGMHPTDMRPKEDFKIGYLVDCIDRPDLHDGRILQIEADFRLAQVEWSTGQVGWWYLKDLVVVGYPVLSEDQKNEQIRLMMAVQAGV